MTKTAATSGRFITLEGVEGAGKSTNLRFVSDWLSARGIDHVVTREPGGTALGEQLRALLLAPETGDLCAMSELLLMFAARAQHLTEVIEPALAQGQWVLCDRFTDATYAYQGGGRGLPTAAIANVETLVQQSRRPDCVLMLDMSVAAGMERARIRGTLDRFEQEPLDFFERVRAGYLARAENNPRYHIVDAAQALACVQAALADILEQALLTWQIDG